AAGAVDRSGGRAVERYDVIAIDGGAGTEVRQPFPSATDAQHFEAELRRAVHDALDHRVQTGHVPTAGEDPDTTRSRHALLQRAMLAAGQAVLRFVRLGVVARGTSVGVSDERVRRAAARAARRRDRATPR